MGINLRRGKKKAKRRLTQPEQAAVAKWIDTMREQHPNQFMPLRLSPPCNGRGHWAIQAARSRIERQNGRLIAALQRMVTPCMVTLTRYSPRLLDTDSLPNCFKATRDGIADGMNSHDGPSAPIKWEYKQERAPKSCFGFVVQWKPLTGESHV